MTPQELWREIARLKNANRRLLMLLEEEKRKRQEGK